MTAISFFVAGEPKGQPRPRAFARRFGSKWSARVYDPGTAEAWKSQIAVAARQHLPSEPITGPVSLTLEFMFPRPKSHFGTGKNAAVLKESAPNWHQTKPDFDNAAKAVVDALTQLGFWRDDTQIALCSVSKTYGGHPGCTIGIVRLL